MEGGREGKPAWPPPPVHNTDPPTVGSLRKPFGRPQRKQNRHDPAPKQISSASPTPSTHPFSQAPTPPPLILLENEYPTSEGRRRKLRPVAPAHSLKRSLFVYCLRFEAAIAPQLSCSGVHGFLGIPSASPNSFTNLPISGSYLGENATKTVPRCERVCVCDFILCFGCRPFFGTGKTIFLSCAPVVFGVSCFFCCGGVGLD